MAIAGQRHASRKLRQAETAAGSGCGRRRDLCVTCGGAVVQPESQVLPAEEFIERR
jgi:hypothetical protein